MDALTFISNLIQATVWPFTAVIALIVLRKPVGEQIGRLLRLKYGKLEISFQEEVETAKRQAEFLNLPKIDQIQEDFAFARRKDLAPLIEISPRSAVLEAWAELEASVGNALVARGIISKARRDSGIRFQASAKNLFTNESEHLKIFLKLLDLRNRAVHISEYPISREEAAAYVDLSTRLIAYISQNYLSNEERSAN